MYYCESLKLKKFPDLKTTRENQVCAKTAARERGV